MTEAKESETAQERPAKKLSDLTNQLGQLAELATNAKRTFFGIALACGYSFLTLFTTTDAELLANSSSSTLPVIDAQIPIVGFFVVIPLALTFGYFYFHMYLQGLWRCVARLPPRTEEDTPIDDYVYPWMISSSLVRSFAAEGKLGRRPLWRVEKAATVALCWWLVPITLAGFWLRYLMAHHWAVTLLHVVLLSVVVVAGIAFYRMAVTTLRRDKPRPLPAWRNRDYSLPAIGGVLTAAVLMVFSVGAIEGAPASHCEEPLPGCEGRFEPGRWLDRLGLGSARLDDVEVSVRPPEWSGELELLEQDLRPIKSTNLVKSDLRHGRANSAFLAAANLTGSNLSWIELRGASLQGSTLEEAALRGAFLEGALLQRASLTNADLTGARLENVRLEQATLDGAAFDKACLIGANLAGASANGALFGIAELTKATLDGARLQHAKLEFAKLGFASAQNVDLTYAKMHGADLRGADLAGAVLSHAKLIRANLSRADLRPALQAAPGEAVPESAQRPPCGVEQPETDGARMSRTQLSKARFTEATLTRICLADAIGEGVDFRRADLRDAHLERAELKFADFRGAKLKNAKFDASELQGAKFDGANLDSAKFTGASMTLVEAVDADLTRADLSGATLLKADFSNARLERARFRKAHMQRAWLKFAHARAADFTEADLSDAQLQGADFTDAIFTGANLTRANLTGARGLEPAQLRAACGAETRFPREGFEGFSLRACPRR